MSRDFALPRDVARGGTHLLLLREERLLLVRLLLERLPPLALARSLRPLLLLRELLRPLDAVPRLLLRDVPDLEDEEELRDAIACSFDRLDEQAVASAGFGPTVNLGRPRAEPVGTHSASA